MDRSRKLEQASANRVAAQRKMTSKSRESEAVTAIDESPLMVSQRAKLQSLFGGAAQRQASEEELLQGKFEPAQRMEEEEPLQGKFAVAQRAEEEELLQGKFEPAQRMEEEEPLQGKFAVAQRAEEEELQQGKFEAAQRMEEEAPLQGKFAVAQRAEEEELLQGKFGAAPSAQRKEEPTTKPNNTGLPDNLKSGIESLSGMSMDNVKVHYNSSQPAQLNALAYAQGTDIHVAPGQEQHLPHEAWHVVQQAQGRVMPTTQTKGTAVNDNAGLEREADVMGGKAVQMVEMQKALISSPELTRYSAIAPVTQLAKLKYQSGNWVTIEESPQGEHKPPENANEGDTFDTVTGEHVRVEVTDNSQSVTTSSSPIITPSSSQSITPNNSQSITPSSSENITLSNSKSITPSSSQSITPSSSQSITPSSSEIITPGSSQSITPSNLESITPGSSQSITPSNSQSITPSNSQSNQGIKRGREEDEGDKDSGKKKRKVEGEHHDEDKTNDTLTGTSSSTSTRRFNSRPRGEIIVGYGGTWTQDSKIEGIDCWKLESGTWHFTVFLDTGHMHLSCAKGPRAGSQIGTFKDGQFQKRIVTKERKGKKNKTIKTEVVDGTILESSAQKRALEEAEKLYAFAMETIAPKYTINGVRLD